MRCYSRYFQSSSKWIQNNPHPNFANTPNLLLSTLSPPPSFTQLQPHWSRVFAGMLHCIQLFATPTKVAHQDPLSWDSPGKNTGVGCLALFQGVFPTQGWKLHLLHWQGHSLPLSYLGSAWPCVLILNCAWPSAWTILAYICMACPFFHSDLFSNVTSPEK